MDKKFIFLWLQNPSMSLHPSMVNKKHFHHHTSFTVYRKILFSYANFFMVVTVSSGRLYYCEMSVTTERGCELFSDREAMLSTQMQTNAHILGKRKNCTNGSETPRRLGSLFIYRQELASLMGEKQKASNLWL